MASGILPRDCPHKTRVGLTVSVCTYRGAGVEKGRGLEAQSGQSDPLPSPHLGILETE